MKQRKTLKGGMNSNSFPSPLSPIYGTTNLAKSTKKRRKSSLSVIVSSLSLVLFRRLLLPLRRTCHRIQSI